MAYNARSSYRKTFAPGGPAPRGPSTATDGFSSIKFGRMANFAIRFRVTLGLGRDEKNQRATAEVDCVGGLRGRVSRNVCRRRYVTHGLVVLLVIEANAVRKRRPAVRDKHHGTLRFRLGAAAWLRMNEPRGLHTCARI